MTDPTPAQRIAALLQRTRLRVGNEAALQASIEGALLDAGIAYSREHRLGPADRPDFFAFNVAIEAKVKYPKRSIYRQLERYAGHDEVHAIILVSATAMGLPAAINGKPVYFVSVGRAFL